MNGGGRRTRWIRWRALNEWEGGGRRIDRREREDLHKGNSSFCTQATQVLKEDLWQVFFLLP